MRHHNGRRGRQSPAHDPEKHFLDLIGDVKRFSDKIMRNELKEETMAAQSYDRLDGVIWYDGKLVPWADANLHVLSHGLHYASAVFEGERAYGGQIFKSTSHSERLKRISKSPIPSPRSMPPRSWCSTRTARRKPMSARSPGAARR
jgi:hypothetical protein